MPPAPTHVALEGVSKAHGVRTILQDVTLGVVRGARVGVVGRNGSGKSTLAGLLAGSVVPDAGRVVRLGGLTVGELDQQDRLAPDATVRQLVLSERAEHEWAGDPRMRAVVSGLLGDLEAGAYHHGFDTPVASMSGGERRRVALARLLVDDPDLLVLDEPNTQEPYVVRTPSFYRSEGRSWGACRTRAAHRVARPRHPGRTSRKAGAR